MVGAFEWEDGKSGPKEDPAVVRRKGNCTSSIDVNDFLSEQAVQTEVWVGLHRVVGFLLNSGPRRTW